MNKSKYLLVGLLFVATICLTACGQEQKENVTSQNHLVVTNLEYSKAGQSYQLDDLMTLTITRRFKLNGQISYRPNDTSGDSPKSGLYADYQMTVSLLPPEGETRDIYYSSDKHIVHIEDGLLSTTFDLPLDFKDQPMFTSPARILIQLDPVNPSAPNGISLSSTFSIFFGNGRLSLEKLSSAERIVQDYLAGLQQTYELTKTVSGVLLRLNSKKQNSKKIFLDTLKLRAFDMTALKGVGVSENEFEQLTTQLITDKDVSLTSARKFCAWIYDYPSNEWSSCSENPGQMLNLFAARHVDTVTKPPKIQSVDSYYIQLSDFTFTEVSSSEEQLTGTRDTKFAFNLTSVAGKVESKLGVSVLGNGVATSASVMNETGIRFGYEWFHVKQHVDRQTREGTRFSFSKNRNIQVQDLELAFEAKADTCLTIASKNNSRPGVQLCRKNEKATRVEHWYFLNQSPLTTGASSPTSGEFSEERLLSAAIRGRSNFNSIMNLLSKEGSATFQRSLHRSTAFSDGNFPGLLSE